MNWVCRGVIAAGDLHCLQHLQERKKYFAEATSAFLAFGEEQLAPTAPFGALTLGLLMQEGCSVAWPSQDFISPANLRPPRL